MSDFMTRDGCWEAFIDQKKRIAALEARLAACEWKPITPESLPEVGDENGGWFSVFNPRWEVRPFEWPMPSSSKLHPEIIHKALKAAGWTHFRAINPPQRERKP